MCPVRAPFLLLNLIIEFFKKKKKKLELLFSLIILSGSQLYVKSYCQILWSEIKYISLDVLVSLSIFTGCAVF